MDSMSKERTHAEMERLSIVDELHRRLAGNVALSHECRAAEQRSESLSHSLEEHECAMATAGHDLELLRDGMKQKAEDFEDRVAQIEQQLCVVLGVHAPLRAAIRSGELCSQRASFVEVEAQQEVAELRHALSEAQCMEE